MFQLSSFTSGNFKIIVPLIYAYLSTLILVLFDVAKNSLHNGWLYCDLFVIVIYQEAVLKKNEGCLTYDAVNNFSLIQNIKWLNYLWSMKI